MISLQIWFIKEHGNCIYFLLDGLLLLVWLSYNNMRWPLVVSWSGPRIDDDDDDAAVASLPRWLLLLLLLKPTITLLAMVECNGDEVPMDLNNIIEIVLVSIVVRYCWYNLIFSGRDTFVMVSPYMSMKGSDCMTLRFSISRRASPSFVMVLSRITTIFMVMSFVSNGDGSGGDRIPFTWTSTSYEAQTMYNSCTPWLHK